MAKHRAPSVSRLRNQDYRDRDLLIIFDECAGPDGLIVAQAVADRLNGNGEAPRELVRCVSQRLSWMHRYHYLARIPPESLENGGKLDDGTRPVRYAIADKGRAIMGGRLTAAVARELERSSPGTEVLIMREIGRRAMIEGDFTESVAVRREYEYASARRVR